MNPFSEIHPFLKLVPRTSGDNRVKGVIQELDEITVNGGCELHQFQIDETNPDDIPADKREEPMYGHWNNPDFDEWFLTSDELNDAVEGLNTRTSYGGYHGSPEFEWWHALLVDGYVAWLLVRGGAYESFEGREAEAKELGEGFVAGIFGDRYEDVIARRSTRQWSDWFATVPHWDETLLMIDWREKRLWLLLWSDTD